MREVEAPGGGPVFGTRVGGARRWTDVSSCGATGATGDIYDVWFRSGPPLVRMVS